MNTQVASAERLQHTRVMMGCLYLALCSQAVGETGRGGNACCKAARNEYEAELNFPAILDPCLTNSCSSHKARVKQPFCSCVSACHVHAFPHLSLDMNHTGKTTT